MKAIVKTSDYFQRFFELLKTSKTAVEAYEALENEYQNKYGQKKYSSYGSFRVMQARWWRSQMK